MNNLQHDERVYFSLPANRMASVDHIVEVTKGKSKKKGVITRGVVGGVLLGPVGAIAGAVTAGNRHNAQTTQSVTTKTEVMDSGNIILTNQRVVFIGSGIISIPYQEVMTYKITGGGFLGTGFSPKYDGMLPNETYLIKGKQAKDFELYYQGITKNIAKL